MIKENGFAISKAAIYLMSPYHNIEFISPILQLMLGVLPSILKPLHLNADHSAILNERS